ncbi:NAD(P)-binding protein [Auriscalpium vulgare]|uniref:NAD(P)-binding protein n=1 Tax=Auriscalpium vulgare TaxID=40419 RepID=A0ACB8RTS7_9AGAM|nr:NAD(P)-binding protein [Auriscalpium vulgare]
MSPVSAPAKALVTGANGYLAVWVVRRLLEAGYSVRGADGAFDEAVQGVELVEHTASPFHFAANDPDELIIPAVRGTTLVLESVKKYGSSVKRVVITSSIVAVFGPYTGTVVFDESAWNDASVSEVREKGAAAGAAWEFIEQNKGHISFDIVTINPPWIFGPPIHELSSLDQLNTSQSEILDTISGKKATKADLSRRATGSTHFNLGSPGAGKTFPYTLLYDTSREARLLGLTHAPVEQMVADSVADFKARGYSQ